MSSPPMPRPPEDFGVKTPNTGKTVDPVWSRPDSVAHFHTDDRGVLHRCYHVCRHRWYLWIPIAFVLQSIAVPLEHTIARWFWTLPILHAISTWIGWSLT
jgi:hypothetical protein